MRVKSCSVVTASRVEPTVLLMGGRREESRGRARAALRRQVALCAVATLLTAVALLAVVLASSAMVHGSARDTLRVVATGVYKPCYMVATGTSATERLLDCS